MIARHKRADSPAYFFDDAGSLMTKGLRKRDWKVLKPRRAIGVADATCMNLHPDLVGRRPNELAFLDHKWLLRGPGNRCKYLHSGPRYDLWSYSSFVTSQTLIIALHMRAPRLPVAHGKRERNSTCAESTF